ncbi:MAG TPA: cobalamin-binding protein [Ktedonobacteraceae bacterium]|nr:cobalamin-binding protein [Ktedonobacteraceae bacterium]
MRIVSLLASATEMIAALGCLDQLVGRSHECDYPPAVLQLPLVSTVQIDTATSSADIDAQIKQLANNNVVVQENALKALSIYAIDLHLLQELQPDIIVTQTQCEVCAVSERDVRQALQHTTGLQPRIVSLAPYQLADVWEDLARVGKALGRGEQAEQLIDGYKQRIEHIKNKVTGLRGNKQVPGVTILEWLDPLMAAGNWTPELVEYAGGDAVFGAVGEHSPWLSWDELRQADPEVLILSPCGFSLERTMQDVPLLRKNPAWQELRAVKQGRVYAIDGNYYLNRSGPRLVDSVEILAALLWGEDIDIAVDRAGWVKID